MKFFPNSRPGRNRNRNRNRRPLRGTVSVTVAILAGLSILLPATGARAQAGDRSERDRCAEVRLNVLFIAIDDLNTRLGCYGAEHISSPHIDRLAARGVAFQRAYCQFPSCGPSRASVLTGLRPETTGMLHNRMKLRDRLPDLVTLPQLFRRQGYHVARVGKIFHQANPTDIGTSGPDDPASWDEVVNPRGRDKDEEDQLTVYTPDLPLPDQMAWLAAGGKDREQTDGKVASETIRLLRQRAGSSGTQPFFLAAGFYRPHIPYIAPREYFDRYQLERTLLPPLAADYREASGVPAAALASTPTWPNFGTTERQARECILAYDACISFVDAQVGRLLEALDELGLSDKTLIVLWGDHGYHLGEHGLWRKNSLFEESTRAPLIFAGPGIPASANGCHRVVEFVDIFPTITELAGLKPPAGLEGVSLTPLLLNPRAHWTRPAFSQVQFAEAPGRSVRTDRWRYSEWGKTDGGELQSELYDLLEDPHELINLSGDARHAQVQAKLRDLLRGHFTAAPAAVN